MQKSVTLKMLRFYKHFSGNDAGSFDSLVSKDAQLFIGTEDEEWFTDREKLRSGFVWDGISIEGNEPQAWEEGTLGWVADRPTFNLRGIGAIRTRFTGVFRREDGAWKLLVSHFCAGVPDKKNAELQKAAGD